MLASHITSKISIVFVNGWSILHLASCSELPMLPLSVHFHSHSPLPFFVCLWFRFAGNTSGVRISWMQLTKKTKHPFQACTLLSYFSLPNVVNVFKSATWCWTHIFFPFCPLWQLQGNFDIWIDGVDLKKACDYKQSNMHLASIPEWPLFSCKCFLIMYTR